MNATILAKLGIPYSSRFDGRTAIVTGAAAGIGRAIAARLTAEGAKLSLWDQNAALAEAVAEIGAIHRAELNISDPDQVARAMDETASAPWIKHEISSTSYGHGIGAGDINGDGRTDIITPQCWFEAPTDPRHGEWRFHPEFDLGTVGFIYTHDVNGDGLPDLVTTAAHDYGIFWYEQKKMPPGDERGSNT